MEHTERRKREAAFYAPTLAELRVLYREAVEGLAEFTRRMDAGTFDTRRAEDEFLLENLRWNVSLLERRAAEWFALQGKDENAIGCTKSRNRS